jgi:transcription elongation GreA/GreB family factor
MRKRVGESAVYQLANGKEMSVDIVKVEPYIR